MGAQLAQQANQLAEKDNQLTEQASLLSEKDKALTTLAKHLLGEGLTISQVAKMTTLPVEEVEKLQSS